MSLLDTASLIVTPNGYKAGTLFSVIPNTTLGDMDVVRATDASYRGSNGLIQYALPNVPRLDYTNGNCPSILVEPQRTNLLTWSEDFTNAVWLGSATKTANTTTSPSGVLNADSLNEVASASIQSSASALINFTSGSSYTMTIYAKNQPSGRGFVQLTGYALGSGSSNVYANFNLNTGVVGNLSGGTSKIEALSNGWYRCSFTFTCGNTITERYNACLISSMSATAFENYSGDITKGIYIWGAQLEEGSYATSYIPTTSASVTRNADVISKTGISSLIGQTEGTLFVDFYHDGLGNFNLSSISNGFYDDAIYFEMYLGNMYAVIWDSGSQQFAYNGGSLSVGRHKMAIGYKNNDVVLYIDGVLKTTDTSATIPTTARLDVGALANATIEKTENNLTALWKTRLTNTQLAQLTTI